MIVISMLLVIVGAVTLVVGAFLRDDLTLVWVSIGSCVAAGIFLVIGILRSRPTRKPVLASGGEGEQASWAGAGAWSASDSEPSAEPEKATTALSRDDEQGSPADSGVAVVGASAVADDSTAEDGSESAWAPADEDTGSVDADADTAAGVEEDGAPQPAVVTPSKKAAAKKSSKKAAAKKSTKKAAAKKSTKKAAAKKAAAKKSSKKAAAKKSTSASAERARIESALTDVSGLGPSKLDKLVATFGDYDSLRAADVSELAAIDGISETLARRIREQL